MSLTKIWIDCSGSVDDILALIILLDAPDYDIVAISCVRGKATVDRGLRNIARVLQVCKRGDIPLYGGAEEPLTEPFPRVDPRFLACEDSAASTFLAPRKSNDSISPASDRHASIHLTEAAKEMEGELILVSLGPFTNVAISCLLDPLFPLRIGKYVAAGGSEVGGDVTLTAEFNVFVDPEGAQLVFRKFPQMFLVTRDVGQKYVWSIEEEWLQKAETSKARLLEGILTVHEEMNDKIEWVGSTAIAAAIVGTPDLVTTTKDARCEMELAGHQTRGQSVFDFGGVVQDSRVSLNIALVTEIDAIQFHQVLRGVIV